LIRWITFIGKYILVVLAAGEKDSDLLVLTTFQRERD